LKSTLIQVFKFLFFTSIAVILIFVVFKNIDLHKFWEGVKQANFIWVGISIIFAAVGYVSRAIRWNLLIEPLGYKPKIKNSILAVIFGYFANIGFPRLGEIARCGVLTRKENIPMDKLIGTVIAERTIDLIMLILLAVITFFIKINFFGKFISNNILSPTTTAFASINIFLIISLILIVILVIVILFVFSKKENSITKKIFSFMKGIAEGIKTVFMLQKRKTFLIHTFIIWLTYLGMTWTICFAIPETSSLSAVDALFLLIVGGLGMAVPVQSGIGVYHYMVGQALTIYGLSFETGLLYATISHESQILFVIITGSIATFYIFIKKPKRESITDNSK
jgi:glycosyltransferase 2 family protein